MCTPAGIATLTGPVHTCRSPFYDPGGIESDDEGRGWET